MTPEEARQRAQATIGESGTLTGLFLRTRRGTLVELDDRVGESDTLVAIYTDRNGAQRTVTLSPTEGGELVPIRSGTALPAPPAPQTTIRSAAGVPGIVDPASGTWTPLQGVPEREPSPSAQATETRLAVEPGTVDWAGGVPIRQWGPGGTYTSLSAYPEVQAGLLDQRIAEVQARRQELSRLADPRFQTPGEGAAETAAIQQQIAALDRELSSYLQARANVGRQLKEPGYATTGGGSYRPLGDVVAEINARERAQLEREIGLIEWKRANGLIEDLAAEREAQERLEEARQRRAVALAEYQSGLRMREARAAWERELPFRQAEERRAGQQLDLQRQTQALSALRGQAEEGQQFLSRMGQAGIAPTESVVRATMDPWRQMWSIIGRLQQQGVVTPEMIPTMSAPTAPVEGAAPRAPMGPAAPMAPVPAAGGPPMP